MILYELQSSVGGGGAGVCAAVGIKTNCNLMQQVQADRSILPRIERETGLVPGVGEI